LEAGYFCNECKRNGAYLESEIIYKSYDIENAKDFNLSQEYIGDVNYYMQRVIVSQKLR